MPINIPTTSIAIAPPFAGLRRFPEGRGFKQWTGDDSKALMKVRLAPKSYYKITNTCIPALPACTARPPSGRCPAYISRIS